MEIIVDDLSGPEVRALLQDHHRNMIEITPVGSAHVLDIEALKAPAITFWSVWIDGKLAACGALKELDEQHGEIKSMRTATPFLRQGVAARLLEHILSEARKRNYKRVSLETGSFLAFEPARKLYEKYGFTYGEPFSQYTHDSNTVFMTKDL